MRIRKAAVEDETHLFDLLKQFPAQSDGYDWEKGVGAFRRMLEDPALGSVFVAEEDGDLLGLITLSYPTAIRCAGPYACIEEFIVDQKGRGKGIGGKLIETAIEEARSRGCYELQVNRPSESGYPVYLHYGWKDLGKHLNLVFPKK
jgi:GNAT superfamily N-acetyltransferase